MGVIAGCQVSVIDAPVAAKNDSTQSVASSRIKAMGGTWDFYCALVDDAVWCWGQNVMGQNERAPVKMANLDKDVVQYSSFASHACALKKDGKVLCWGNGSNGHLGDDEGVDRYTPDPAFPVIFSGHPTATVLSIDVGYEDSCALTNEGLFCWGRSFGGVAIKMPDFDFPIKKFELGMDWFSICVLLENDDLRCWSSKWNDTLGAQDPAFPAVYPDPIVRASASNRLGIPTTGINSLAVNDHGDFCVSANGHAWCWGENWNGAVGSGAEPDVPVAAPSSVLDEFGNRLNGVKQLFGQDHVNCALMEDETVRCWGRNQGGELGYDPALIPSSNVALPVPNVSGIRVMGSSENSNICAATADKVYCWGENWNGALGMDPADVQSSFVPIQINSSW